MWKKYYFLLFSEKCWYQRSCWDSRLIIPKKIAWLPQLFFVDSNSPCKNLPFPSGPNLAQKPLYSVWWQACHWSNIYEREVWYQNLQQWVTMVSLIPEHAYYVPVGRFQSNCVSVKYPPLRHQQEKVFALIPLLNSVRV